MIRWYYSIVLSLLWLLVGCSLTAPPDIIPPPDPTSAPVTGFTPTPAPPTLPDEWTAVREGMSWREYIPNGNVLARLVAVRIDPSQYRFRVHYSPGVPRDLTAWRQELPDAVAIINANFFSPEFTALGLVIADGVPYGASYVGRGGTFAVQNGMPLLRSNITTPYAGEAFEQAAQAFPMLVENGEQAYTRSTDNGSTRRSIIAQDTSGNILLMIAPLLGPGLYDLSALLAENEALDIVTAINLDGGGSSLLYAEDAVSLAPFDPVPVVIAVYEKD